MCAHLRFLSLAFVSCLCLAGLASAQSPSSDAELIRGYFRNYLTREPTEPELSAWVRELQRGTSPTMVRGLILASDESYRRYESQPRSWLAVLYKEMLGREPTAEELSRA